jgi:hypothetical protein
MSAGFTAIAERLREKTDFFKRIKLFQIRAKDCRKTASRVASSHRQPA